MPLLAPPVGHWCRKSGEAGNVSESQWKRIFIPQHDDGSYSKCTVYSVGFVMSRKSDGGDALGRSRSAATAVTPPREELPCSSWDYDVSPGLKTLTSEWNLVCERRGLLFVAVMYNNLGGLVALPFVGQVADRFGRWPVMVVSLLLALLAAIGTVFTSTFATFIIARMLVTGSLSALALVMVLSMFAGCADLQRQRSVCAAHLVVATAALAPRLMAGMVLDRRVLCLVVLLCTLPLLLLVLLCVDESPRWMRVVFDSPGAESKTTTALHRFTRRLSTVMTHKHMKTTARMRLRKQNILGSVGLVIDPNFRTRTLVLVFTLFTLLSSLVVTTGKETVNLELLDLVLRMFCLVAADQLLLALTRRDALLLALPCVCLLASVEALATAMAAASVLPVLRELLFDSVLANLALVCTYSLELYPTAMRATGLGTVYFAGGVCATATPLLERGLQPPLLELCSVLLTVTSLSLVPLLPETMDTSLVETTCDLERLLGRPSSTEGDEMFVDVDRRPCSRGACSRLCSSFARCC
ncbi:organic cation transporter protein-like [Amblyomma americanum]